MSDDVSRRALLRGVGAVGIGAGVLALFPSLAAAAPLAKVLVFARAAGSRHGPVSTGAAAIRQLGGRHGRPVDAAEDANTVRYQAVVWLSNTDGPRRIPFESYVNSGGSYVGMHAGVDTGHHWEWYGGLTGAYFAADAGRQQATFIVEDRMNDSTAHLPATWNRFDEWDHDRRTYPRGAVHVLMRLDESFYRAGATGADQPVIWWHEAGAGHAWYTGLGHTASHSDTLFTRLLLGDVRVAVRAIPAKPGNDRTLPNNQAAALRGTGVGGRRPSFQES